MKDINEIMKDINKKHGKGSISLLKDSKKLESISTGSFSLDKAVGIGGLPRGRIIEILGTQSCLFEDTFINYQTRTKNGKIQNRKGGTIKNLYELFNHIKTNKKTINSDYFVSSVNEKNRIIKNKVFDVVKCGIKECYKLETEKGYSLISTPEHKYFNGSCFKSLKNLSVGDIVHIHNNTYFTKDNKEFKPKEIFVKYHPFFRKKIVENKYLYFRGRKSRAIYEAFMNNISYEEYVDLLNTKSKIEINKLKFIPTGYDIHHKDKDIFNNSLENLELIKSSEHYRLHSTENHNNLRFISVPDKIKKITQIGKVETYDIKCLHPYNNYVANNIVVHNSGKTTLALNIISQAQKQGLKTAFIDAENSMSSEYAEKLGVDTKDLLLSQPENGEEALNIVETLIRTNEIAVIVIDSVAALTPKVEIEGEVGKQIIGLQAKMMSQALRKFAAIASKSNTLLIFINQIREKIGVMWGSNETTPGGRALAFYSSVRLDVRRKAKLKNKEDVIVGSKVLIKVVKNKVAAPFKETEVDIIFAKGIDYEKDVLSYAIKNKVVKKEASTYSFNGKKLGVGLSNVSEILKGDKKLLDSIIKKLL